MTFIAAKAQLVTPLEAAERLGLTVARVQQIVLEYGVAAQEQDPTRYYLHHIQEAVYFLRQKQAAMQSAEGRIRRAAHRASDMNPTDGIWWSPRYGVQVTMQDAAKLLGCPIADIETIVHLDGVRSNDPHNPNMFPWAAIRAAWMRKHDEQVAHEVRANLHREPVTAPPRFEALRAELCEAYGVTVVYVALTASWIAIAERGGVKHEATRPTRAGAEDAVLDLCGAPAVTG